MQLRPLVVLSSITIGLLGLTIACGDGPTDPRTCDGDYVVSIRPDTASLRVGDSAQLDGEVMGPKGFEAERTAWASQDTMIATVGSAGSVYAIRDGTTFVSFTAYFPPDAPCVQEEMSAVSEVAVECARTLRGMQMTPSEATVAVGDSIDYEVTVGSPCFAGTITEADTSVLFRSSDTSVAVVDSLGLALALDSGRALIHATLESDPSHSVNGVLTVVPE